MVKFVTNVSGILFEITQVKESIPWVRCASGNVLILQLICNSLPITITSNCRGQKTVSSTCCKSLRLSQAAARNLPYIFPRVEQLLSLLWSRYTTNWYLHCGQNTTNKFINKYIKHMKVQAARKIQVARILNLPHLFSQFKHQLLSLTTCQCCGQGTYIFSKIPPTNTKSIKHMMKIQTARKIQASRNPPQLLPQLQHQLSLLWCIHLHLRSKYHKSYKNKSNI